MKQTTIFAILFTALSLALSHPTPPDVSAKGICATSSYSAFTDVHAHVQANIAIDLPTSGMPFAGFTNDILPLNELLLDVYSSSTLLQVLADVDTRVKVSTISKLPVPVPEGMSALSFKSFGAGAQLGLDIQVSNPQAHLEITMITPTITSEVNLGGKVSMLKLEGGGFYRCVASVMKDGRFIAQIKGDEITGSYVFVKN